MSLFIYKNNQTNQKIEISINKKEIVEGSGSLLFTFYIKVKSNDPLPVFFKMILNY